MNCKRVEVALKLVSYRAGRRVGMPFRKFTLIELLVVVTIIAILASMLLPVLTKAKESARRAICLSNLKQLYLGVISYTDEANTHVPYQWCTVGGGTPGWDGSLGTESSQYHRQCTHAGDTWDTGWKLMDDLGYIDFAILECPSMGWKPVKGGHSAWGMHYSYRYNSRRSIAYGDGAVSPTGSGDLQRPRRGLLSRPDRGWRALITDAANCRRVDGCGQIADRNINAYQRRWSHRDGGNVLTHDGAAYWLPNQPVGGAHHIYPAWPRCWYVWYGSGWTRGLDPHLSR